MNFRGKMENVLLDKHVTYFKQEEFSEYIKEYKGTKYEVGEDIAEKSTDVECAKFCIEHDCDFLTADKKAYDEIFTIKEIKSIEITRILENEPTINRPVYSLSFKTEHL